MLRALRTCLCAALVAAATIAAAGADLDAADAARTCTARAAMPSQVVLTSRQAVISATLTGTAACTATPHDYGATATLRNPTGSLSDAQRWSRFGTSQRIQFTVDVDELGTYTMRSGDVQVYDGREIRVPWSWVTTSVTVRDGSRLSAVRRSGTRLTATLRRYTAIGWDAWSGVLVVLQQHRGTGWVTTSRAHTTRTGGLTLRAPAHGSYRLVSASTSTVAPTAVVVR